MRAYPLYLRYERCVIKLKVCVDLNVIRSNLIRIKKEVGVKVMLMVKADAYGHGLCEVAKAVEDVADCFGVATLEEGVALRHDGIQKDILVLVCASDELKSAFEQRLTVGLANSAQLYALEQLISDGEVSPANIRIHLAVDSGMHRLGFAESDIDEVAEKLKSLGVELGGVYSHLRARSYRQIYAFERACAEVEKCYPNVVRHIASSHSLAVRRLCYDMVRVGISAYEGAMAVESTVVAVRKVDKDEYVSYGRFKLKSATNTAVVFGGYADGSNRERPSSVYIRGKECRVLGRVCMDMCVVDCGDFLPYVGERAVLTDAEHISNIAKQRSSIDYTVMTCWRGRIERIYKYDESGGASLI